MISRDNNEVQSAYPLTDANVPIFAVGNESSVADSVTVVECDEDDKDIIPSSLPERAAPEMMLSSRKGIKRSADALSNTTMQQHLQQGQLDEPRLKGNFNLHNFQLI